jgi:transcriptional regulator with XRE-family HTH domain
MDFNLIFKDLRKSNKLTQSEFAKKLFVSRSAVAQIESSHNKPSKELITVILGLKDFIISGDLREDLDKFAFGKKNQISSGAEESVTRLYDEEEYDSNTKLMWDTYRKLNVNMDQLMCLCIAINELKVREFTREELNALYAIEISISYLDNLTHRRIRFHKTAFKNAYNHIKTSYDLIDDFTVLLLSFYRNKIRNVSDLFKDNHYEDENIDVFNT